ncbi:MAG: hypothetical protein ACR2G1_02140 [Rubrobacteraceae bacterium]
MDDRVYELYGLTDLEIKIVEEATARIHEASGAAGEILSSGLRTVVEEKLAGVGAPGAQIAVRRDGELLWSACAGRLRRDAREDSGNGTENVGREDRFVIASGTSAKVATATITEPACYGKYSGFVTESVSEGKLAWLRLPRR